MTRPSVIQHACKDRPEILQSVLDPSQARRRGHRGDADTLSQPPDHDGRFAQYGIRRTHQPLVTADQRRPLVLAARLQPNGQTPARRSSPALTAAPHAHSVSRGHVMFDQVTCRRI